MGRRKQSRPHRSGGIILETPTTAEAEVDKQRTEETGEEPKNEFGEIDKPYFVEVDRSSWLSNEHLDISEIVLTDLNLREGFSGSELSEDFYQDLQYSLRFRLCNVNNFLGRIKLGHWPVLCYSDIHLELVKRRMAEDIESYTVLLSGIFDGPDEASFVVVDESGKEKALSSGSKVGCLVSQVLFYEQVRALQKSPEWPEIFKSTMSDDSKESLCQNTSQQENETNPSDDDDDDGLPPLEVNTNRMRPLELQNDADSESSSDTDT